MGDVTRSQQFQLRSDHPGTQKPPESQEEQREGDGSVRSSIAHTNSLLPTSNGGFSDREELTATGSQQAPEPPVAQHLSRMSRSHAAAVMGYVPATAHFGKQVWVDCYAVPPGQHVLKRKQYRCNRGTITERKQMARDLVVKLNEKLRRGWNPWNVEVAPKGETTLRKAVAAYLAVKLPTLTNRSHFHYTSQAKRFMAWAEAEGLAEQPVENITKSLAYRFLDHVREEGRVNNNTWNNIHNYTTIMFNWMVEREYRRNNPFAQIKRLRKVEKFRSILLPEERQACLEWFEKHDPRMVLPCLFVFHTLLRPRAELLRIRIKDIDMEGGLINVSGINSKSKRIRRPAIPHAMVPYLERSGLLNEHPDFYVVGHGMGPGPLKSGYNTMGDRWNKMRKALGWPAEKQLYSMRDSGIVQLIADGVDLHAVMIQADHKNIETTNRYVQHYFPGGVAQIQKKASPFIGRDPS